jgi:glycosyltransferase involved in cell wall biosynthesis
VVVTNAGGPAYIVEDEISGLLTPPDDPTTLAHQLGRILADPDLAARLSDAARRRALRFGWGSVACDILDVYRTALGARRLAVAV